MSSLKWSLDSLRPADRMLLVPLCKEYDALSFLRSKGINALVSKHRAKFEAIKASVGEEWKILIATSTLKHTRRTGYYGDILENTQDTSIVQIFDEEGNDVTSEEEWLKQVVDFDCCDEAGMMLASYEDEYAERWGCCTSSSTRGYRKTTEYKTSFIIGQFHSVYISPPSPVSCSDSFRRSLSLVS